MAKSGPRPPSRATQAVVKSAEHVVRALMPYAAALAIAAIIALPTRGALDFCSCGRRCRLAWATADTGGLRLAPPWWPGSPPCPP